MRRLTVRLDAESETALSDLQNLIGAKTSNKVIRLSLADALKYRRIKDIIPNLVKSSPTVDLDVLKKLDKIAGGILFWQSWLQK